MRVFPMFNIVIMEPYIAQPTIAPFGWVWDFIHWVLWMLHYSLQPPRMTRHMLQIELTNPPRSLSGSNTSSNRFRIFYRSPMPSTSSAMINIGCHTSFRWEINFGYTCRKNVLQNPIGRFIYSAMDLTPSPRLRVTILLISTFPPSLGST